MISGGLSESPVKRHVAKEEGRPIRIFCNTEEYGMLQFTESKCLNVSFSATHFLKFHTMRKCISETEVATEAQYSAL